MRKTSNKSPRKKLSKEEFSCFWEKPETRLQIQQDKVLTEQSTKEDIA